MLRQNNDVSTRLMPTQAAIEAGAVAMFGEKYGDEVRVLAMGNDIEGAEKPYSVELCGGTHVRRLGDIGLFTVLAESAVTAGVRRIEALTSEGARAYLEGEAKAARAAAAVLKTGTADLPPTNGLVAWARSEYSPTRSMIDARNSSSVRWAGFTGGGVDFIGNALG